MPTLEEYTCLTGIPLSSDLPYTGLEGDPDERIIARATHLKVTDIKTNMVVKGGLFCLPAKFLMEKACEFEEAKRLMDFEAVIALLVYGLFLFPNMEGYVDIKAIKVFIIGNPVPTLLADAYHSVHQRSLRKGGMITCCAILLIKWFAFHMPHSKTFWNLKDGILWSKKIMALTNTDINWCYSDLKGKEVIVNCGEFANVPLLGTKGCITYNPSLAYRQFGYSMCTKPKSINLEGLYFEEGQNPALQERMAQAWKHIRRFGIYTLGTPDCIADETYTRWVQERAISLELPYERQEPISLTPREPILFFTSNEDELKIRLAQAEREKLAWMNKYQILGLEMTELHKRLEDQDPLKKRKLGEAVAAPSTSVPPEPWRTRIWDLEDENERLRGEVLKLSLGLM